MEGYKYQCYFRPDGTLYNGGWIHKSVLPKDGAKNMLLLDDLPPAAEEGFVHIWDGENIVCVPRETIPGEEGEEVTYT